MGGKQRPSAAVKEYLQLIQIDSGHGHEVKSSDRQQGVVFKSIEVVGGDAGIIYQDTVTTRAWHALNFIPSLLSNKKPARRTILHGISGALNEGEMLLVLGRPGSGCTTLLKTLAGMTESFHGWTGDISYWGLPVDSIKNKFRGDVVCNAEGLIFLLDSQTNWLIPTKEIFISLISRSHKLSILRSIPKPPPKYQIERNIFKQSPTQS